MRFSWKDAAPGGVLASAHAVLRDVLRGVGGGRDAEYRPARTDAARALRVVPGEGAYRGNLGYGARDPVAGVDAVFFVGTDALDRPPEEGDLLRVDGRAPGATEPAWRVYKVSRDDTGAVYQRVSSGMQYAVACKDADGEAW